MKYRRETFRFLIVTICYLLIGLYTIYWIRAAFEYLFDFSIYYRSTLAAQAGQSAYFPYHVGGSFLYSPAVLTFVSLFSWTGKELSSLLWIAASLFAYGTAIYIMFRLSGTDGALSQQQARFVMVLLVGFMPFWEANQLGQINVFVVACLALCLYCFDRDKRALAGVFLGIAILLKTSPLVFVFYFLSLRQFRVILAALVTLLVACAISLFQFGPVVFSDFLTVTLSITADTNAGSYLNLSLVATLQRVLSVFEIRNAEVIVNLLVRAILGIPTALILVSGLFIRPEQKALKLWLFALLTILMTIISPLVWFHHETFLVIPFSLLLLRQANTRYFFGGVLAILVMQSERLFYNVIAVSIGRQFPNLLPTVLAFITALPSLLAQFGLLAMCLSIYLRDLRLPVILRTAKRPIDAA